jgi:GMP synthase (glutamine-hydrolysing)
MRKNESLKVKKALKNTVERLMVVDASSIFMEATTFINGRQTLPLNKTVNPEEKRKIIGDTFMKVVEMETSKLGLDPDHTFIAQGTLRPGKFSLDTIFHSNYEQFFRSYRERFFIGKQGSICN